MIIINEGLKSAVLAKASYINFNDIGEGKKLGSAHQSSIMSSPVRL